MSTFFYYPWAIDGDLGTAIPVSDPGTGSLSYQDGFTVNYEQDLLTNPTALPIPRAQFNQLMNAITGEIQQYQTQGTPLWITSSQNQGTPYPYAINARVRYDAGGGLLTYVNQVAANTATPGADNSWLPVGKSFNVNVPSGSAISLTNLVVIDLASILLPPGIWLIFGNMTFNATSTNQGAVAWLNTSSTTAPNSSHVASSVGVTSASATLGITTPPLLLTVTTPTTVYLSGYCGFTAGTADACGTLTAMAVV
jgi:hypothetical protein